MIRLSKSCLGEAEKQAVSRILDKEYLGMGEEVQLFENELTSLFKRPVVCVSSGTAALQFALESLGIGYGDEVLVQSLTYVASFQAISATGAKPISCEVDSSTFCFDIKDAKQKISKKTRRKSRRRGRRRRTKRNIQKKTTNKHKNKTRSRRETLTSKKKKKKKK